MAMKTVGFTAMKDGSRADYLLLQPLEHEHVRGTADRVHLVIDCEVNEWMRSFF